MLAYPLEEAEGLLESKLDAAQSSRSNCEEDLDFLREQITVRRSQHVEFHHCPVKLTRNLDHGSSDRTSVQLGRRRAEKRKGWWQGRHG